MRLAIFVSFFSGGSTFTGATISFDVSNGRHSFCQFQSHISCKQLSFLSNKSLIKNYIVACDICVLLSRWQHLHLCQCLLWKGRHSFLITSKSHLHLKTSFYKIRVQLNFLQLSMCTFSTIINMHICVLLPRWQAGSSFDDAAIYSVASNGSHWCYLFQVTFIHKTFFFIK